MDRSVLVVFTNVLDNRDDEFNDWYDNIHLQDVVDLPGYVGASRYRVSSAQLAEDAPLVHKYMALYEIEGDPAVAIKALAEASPTMNISDSLDTATTTVLVYDEISRLS